MDSQQVLEKVPQPIQIRFSFAPHPGADLKTIQLALPKNALLLDAIRQSRMEHHVPVYLEQSMLSTARTLIQETRRTQVEDETRRVNETLFSPTKSSATEDPRQEAVANGNDADAADAALQRAMIEIYRSHTTQFHTRPEENLFPEAYHTLVHSPIPSLFDSILQLEREYAGEVDALLSARDAEVNEIQTRHHNALSGDSPQRGLTHLMTRHIEKMEVSLATWNSQLDDLQSIQRAKYQEFILELYSIYKKRQLALSRSTSTAPTNGTVTQDASLGTMDGKEMVAAAMKTIGERRSNVEQSPAPKAPILASTKDLPAPPPESQDPDNNGASSTPALPGTSSNASPSAPLNEPEPPAPPPKPARQEDVELNKMIKSILEMGFDEEQARGALTISNRNMDHAINLLLEQPENIPRLVLAKQKVEAMKENARLQQRQNRAQSSPQQPLPSLVGSNAHRKVPADHESRPVGRPADRSFSVSSPRPTIGGMLQNNSGAPKEKPWSPLPSFLQQKNALLANNSNPSVKKLGGWLNKAIENLGLDDELENTSTQPRGAISTPVPQQSNLTESFTVVLGSSHSKVTHNLRLMVSDPAEIFPTNRVKSESDLATQAQTASLLYGQNLTGLVQLVNIKDWAKYKGGQVCHQEFFQSCQTSTELHFDSIEKQLEAMEKDIPLDGSTLREGDFILTRHSNLPMIHVVFHLFYGQSIAGKSPGEIEAASASTSLPMFSQPSDFSPKPDFLAGLRSILRTAHRYEITVLSIPFLMLPPFFENQMASALLPQGRSSSHHLSGYGSPSSSSMSNAQQSGGYGSSTTSSPSVASLSSFASSSATAGTASGSSSTMVTVPLTDQTRRDFQRRAESILRHLKSYLMENARQVKQVGNQGSEAEKFRASQGGDVKVLQFMLPKGTSDEMFRTFRIMLVNVFGGA